MSETIKHYLSFVQTVYISSNQLSNFNLKLRNFTSVVTKPNPSKQTQLLLIPSSTLVKKNTLHAFFIPNTFSKVRT